MSKKEKLLCQYLGDIIVLTNIVSFLDVLSNIKELLNTEEDISQISFENITDSEEINLLDQLKLLVDPFKDAKVNLLLDLFSNDDYFKTVAWEKSVKKLEPLIFAEETIKEAPNENTNVPLKRLARKLFDILNISQENFPPFIDLVSFLLNEMHHSEKTSLKETLDKIIEETEKILKDSPIYFKYVSKPPFHKTNFSNILGIGIFIANQSCDALVEKILDLILEIDRGHSDFSISSQSIIGYSMILAINPIKLYIEDIYSTCRFRSFSSIERSKSALKIIFNEYSKYTPPTPEYQQIKKSIDLLNQIDEKFCDSSDTE
ncbi:uncharacterized protein [Parasteatoda tepidariorum]|uniref:uncharacterized protein n=1 Tax=Parasteatoda tepidariorum TaxID=114398 RepID=UPI00077F82C3|nr:uncharacterized protein LOC107453659 [Parasteatoda tepidariorum]